LFMSCGQVLMTCKIELDGSDLRHACPSAPDQQRGCKCISGSA
jgi:hypothetical protein